MVAMMPKSKAKTQIPEHVQEYLQEFPQHKRGLHWLMLPPRIDEVCEIFPEAARLTLDGKEMIFRGVTRLSFYCCLRECGESHAMAEMLATQRTAALMTDDVFFAGLPMLGDSVRNQSHLDSLVASAKRHGYTPSPNDVYLPNLARFRGDPEAFVDRTKGRAHIKRVLEHRGWECDGAVTTAGRPADTDPLAPENCVSLAEDIIWDTAREKVEADPSLKKMDRRELREKIIAEHGQH